MPGSVFQSSDPICVMCGYPVVGGGFCPCSIPVTSAQGGSYGHWGATTAAYDCAADASSTADPRAIATLTAVAARTRYPASIPHTGIRAGEIIAWRAWKLVSEGIGPFNRLRLRSVTMFDVWKPGEPMEGNPLFGLYGCGVHAFKNRIDADRAVFGREYVIGEVAMWGDVVEHEWGFRASHAYPHSFHGLASDHDPVIPRSSRRILKRLRKIYAVK